MQVLQDHDSDERKKIEYFSFLLPSSSKEVSADHLMQKVELGVLKYHGFDNRDLYLLVAFDMSSWQDSDAKEDIVTSIR